MYIHRQIEHLIVCVSKPLLMQLFNGNMYVPKCDQIR